MTDEKPLHVQVAEALGWTDLRGYELLNLAGEVPRWEWHGTSPDGRYVVDVPDYDTDWSATGPLIEKYRLDVFSEPDELWSASPDAIPTLYGYGKSPCEAVCHLILQLAKAGELKQKPIRAESKSQYKRLTAQGAEVLPPDEPRDEKTWPPVAKRGEGSR